MCLNRDKKEDFDNNSSNTTTTTTTTTTSSSGSNFCYIICIIFALILSYKCNGNDFNILSIIAALCCPCCYIIGALIMMGTGSCTKIEPVKSNGSAE